MCPVPSPGYLHSGGTHFPPSLGNTYDFTVCCHNSVFPLMQASRKFKTARWLWIIRAHVQVQRGGTGSSREQHVDRQLSLSPDEPCSAEGWCSDNRESWGWWQVESQKASEMLKAWEWAGCRTRRAAGTRSQRRHWVGKKLSLLQSHPSNCANFDRLWHLSIVINMKIQ